ncbi:helix-turn-helix domain-containing protein [Saccharopolyspora hattusasensis]|uniref:helix-turn-helix domain-containing protein n=1 Tax=Saccharopolyspora hattusasensis TaxID=1128679 RepID=UPI003D995968
MGSAHRYPQNARLAWERLQRGWSHDELADQIKQSIRDRGDAETGLTGHTVRRWETGERWPEPRFRKHLVLVFGKPASELGLLTHEELSLRPVDDELCSVARRLLAMTADSGKGFSRELFLRGLVGVGLLPLVAPLEASADAADTLAYAAEAGSGADATSAASFAFITAQQRPLYWSAPPQALLDSTLAHTRLGIQLIRETRKGTTVRRDLAAALAESALLSARLAYFDLRRVDLAQRCFDTAQEASREANDHALIATVLAHASFVPGFEGDKIAAQPLLEAAHAHAQHGCGPLLRSWLHCVSAEVTAKTGDPAASLQHARQAEDALAADGIDPMWLDFYDASRLAGFTGNAQLVAGDHSAAAANLLKALDSLGPQAAKQRSVLLLDLALASAKEDAERSASLACEALDALQQDWYGTAFERLPRVCASLAGTPFASDLDDRMRAFRPSGD